MRFFRNSVEKDTECFVKGLVKLSPLEFNGVAKILGIRTTRDPKELDINLDEYTSKTDEEKEAIKDALLIPAEEILVKMIDKFAELSKKQRRRVLEVIKAAIGG